MILVKCKGALGSGMLICSPKSVFVILGKLLRLFEPQLAYLYIGDKVLPSSLRVMGIKLGQ